MRFSYRVYHRDYVIRLIEQFVVILARLAGLKAKDDPQVILLETETALKAFTGLDPELVRRLSASALAAILTARDPEDHTALAAAAILLKTEGDACRRMGDTDLSVRRYSSARSLLALVQESFLPDALKEHVRFGEELDSLLREAQTREGTSDGTASSSRRV